MAACLVNYSFSQVVAESKSKPARRILIFPHVHIYLFLVRNFMLQSLIAYSGNSITKNSYCNVFINIISLQHSVFTKNFRFSRSITGKCFSYFTRVNRHWRKTTFVHHSRIVVFNKNCVQVKTAHSTTEVRNSQCGTFCDKRKPV